MLTESSGQAALYLTAVHEAGHFVAAYVAGQHEDVYSISIVPNADYAGIVDMAYPDLDTPDQIESAIVGLYAGFAASVHQDPEMAETTRQASRDDDDRAALFIRALGRPHGEVEAELRSRAALIVETHWTLIEALAADLMEHGKVEGHEAVWVIEAATGDLEAAQALAEWRAFHGGA